MITEIPIPTQSNIAGQSGILNSSQPKLSQTEQLVALRTKAQLDSSSETTEAFFVEVPSKFANRALKYALSCSCFAQAYPNLNHRAADEVIREQSNKNLNHLRRFVKPEHLPSHLGNDPTHSISVPDSKIQRQGIIHEKNSSIISIGDEDSSRDEEVLAGNQLSQNLYFLIGATSSLSYETALKLVESICSSFTDGTRPQLRTTTVPIFPPISQQQAMDWSRDYWPINYKKNNPFGAHPSIVSRAEHEMQEMAGERMSLAKIVGKELSEAMMGEPVGAVVVDRTCLGASSVVVVAGDARWVGCEWSNDNPSGNVMAHAVMRAIGLVARKRRDLLGENSQEISEPEGSGCFMDTPLTTTEAEAYKKKTLAPGGYLCLGLELYVTHEPCVMCTMAILHSRFERVVFRERLPRTGGVSAERNNPVNDDASNSQGLGYGLFWRPDLNWKLLAWQLMDEDCVSIKLSHPDTHA